MTRALVVVVDATDVDIAVDALWMHGALAVATDGDRVAERLTASFADDVDPVSVGDAVVRAVPTAHVDVVDDDGTWWDAWRDHARPVEIAGGRVIVAPAWLPAPSPLAEGLVVTIDPGHTFGSGAHATTRLVLEALVRLPLAGARVLDVGCGSGVLAVVAARLGAADVLAVDVDAACVDATLANARANGVEVQVHATVDPLADLTGALDVVVANVLLPAFEAVAPELRRLATRTVVVSGMLDGTEHRTLAAIGTGWRCAERSSDDGWTSALLVRDDLLT